MVGTSNKSDPEIPIEKTNVHHPKGHPSGLSTHSIRPILHFLVNSLHRVMAAMANLWSYGATYHM
jgi:hypothetical protein